MKCYLLGINERVFSLIMLNGFEGNHNSPSTTKPYSRGEKSCYEFNSINLVSYVMNCSNRLKLLLWLSAKHNRWAHPLLRQSRQMILLHHNACPRITAPIKTYFKTQLRSPTPPEFTRHCLCDDHLFKWNVSEKTRVSSMRSRTGKI